MPHYLAFDLGASSGRAILGTLEGDRIRLEEVHRFPTHLIELERLYWDLVAIEEELRTGLTRALERNGDIHSVSVTSWGVDFVPLDAGLRPLRNAYCYRDERVSGMMEACRRAISKSELYAITGIQFMEINTIYQLLADLRFEPDRFERTSTHLMIADYLNFRLGAEPVNEVSLASTTQLMDVRAKRWSERIFERLGLDARQWGRIVPSGSRIGTVSDRPEIEVIASCSHDTASAVAAVPADDGAQDWAYISSGTWSLFGIESSEPVLTDAAREASYTNEAGVDDTIRFLKNIAGLWVLQECEREWREAGERFTYEQLISEASGAERHPTRIDLDDPGFVKRGNMVERIRTHCKEGAQPVPETRGQLVRAILEGLAESYRKTHRKLEALTGRMIGTIHIVGGGSQNELLCQMTADACGCRVLAGPVEATAIGNLLIQANAMGDLPPRTSMRDIVRRSFDLQEYRPSQPWPWNGGTRN